MASGVKTLLRLLPALVLAGAASPGHGQSDATLADPTRPPAQVEPAPANAAANVAAAALRSGLQTVILREGHRPMAVINGVQVELGGKLGDATLIKLNEYEAVLQSPTGRETLRMIPGVEKTSASSDQAVPKGKPKQGIKRKPDGSGEQGNKQTPAPPQPNPPQ